MTKPDEHGPTNPREWDPNHQLLKSPQAPHETAGFLRMHRAGYKGADIMKMFKLRGTQMQRQMQKALDDETQASDRRRDIHDALIKR
jgi:hypothetical protein